MDFFFQLFVLAMLLGSGLIIGGWNERAHFKRIKKCRQQLSGILVTQLKSFPQISSDRVTPKIVMGEVVIATDYMKSFLAGIRNIFGGEVRSYHTLLIRAREEAMVRMLKKAQKAGYNAVCNVRLETADVGANSLSKATAMVAIIASGTAYHAQIPDVIEQDDDDSE